MKEVKYGIEFSKPTVTLLQETGIGTAELAARTCYDSYDQSENDAIRIAAEELKAGTVNNLELFAMNSISNSELLDKLAWTHFHHSILEHASLTYLIQGTSRGVLQEHARHRIQSISVRSTRYTMQNILNRYIATIEGYNNLERLVIFTEYIKELDMFVVNNDFIMLEIKQLFDKLELHRKQLGDEEFLKLALSNDAFTAYSTKTSYYHIDVLTLLDSAKNKRNVGDAFKWVVTDNWKVDMVVTMNIRALKNYLTLRDSGAAYFQMRWLAQAIKSVTPNRYLSLIDTECRNKD